MCLRRSATTSKTPTMAEKGQAAAFGRDEMTALLGGERQAFVSSTKRRRTGDDDVSQWTSAQAAAHLKQGGSSRRIQPQRLRAHTKNLPQHHLLLLEEQEKQKNAKLVGTSTPLDQSSSEAEQDDDGDNFVKRPQRKAKTEARVISKAAPTARQEERIESEPVQRRQYLSSSEESNGEESDAQVSRRRRRRSDASSSSSSSSGEEDNRRARLLAKRRERKEAAVVVSASANDKQKIVSSILKPQSSPEPTRPRPKTDRDVSDSSSSSGEESSSSGSTGSSSSEEDSSSSEDDEKMVAKPMFVPKHKRHTVLDKHEKEKQENEKELKRTQEIEKRRMESRAMVVMATTATANSTQDNRDDADDEMGGDVPNDSDNDDDMQQQRDLWEVRELQRLLEHVDVLEAQEEERKDHERRLNMTEQELMKEDMALGRYKAPGQDRKAGVVGRYFHRGAFYMDQDEWKEGDVRHKAKDYERALVGEDKVDRRNLPKVMQVKKFGFSGNTRYKGLAREDTSTKQDVLPLVHSRRKPKK